MGAPRIHGELMKLGFKVSEPTVSRWLRRVPRTTNPTQRWLTFLRNHRQAIAAMDFFTVPTLTFGVLYCFFVIAHDRRKILGCNVTRNPTAFWIMQLMREAWSYSAAHKFLLFYRDARFGKNVVSFTREMGSKPVRTAFRSPWQNGVAERWVGSCRRDLLDHVIVLNERHLKRLMAQYVRYYNCASYCPPDYVVENSKPSCSAVGIAEYRLPRRTRSTNLLAVSISSARRLRTQGPSDGGCSASISPRSIANRSVMPLIWS